MNLASRPFIPWSAWAASAFLTLAVLGTVTGIYWWQESPAHYKRASLEALAQAAPGGRVVMLGSSRLRHGMGPEAELEKRLAQALQRPVHLVRIARNQGRLEDFAPLGPALDAAAPQWVLIESSFMRDGGPPAPAWQQHWMGLRGALHFRMFPWRWFNGMTVHDWVITKRESSATLVPEGRRFAEAEAAAPWGLHPAFAPFVRHLLQRGAQVTLLDVPSFPPCGKVEMAQAQRLFEALPRELREDPRLRLEGPRDLDWAPQDYLDLRHLSGSGRQRYEDWFLRRAAALRGELVP